ncbi:MAG TPA: alpha/beta fold hydrolase [Mycobacteriales bacterium]|nr:alpha/beta fold hydrolase [Mycobacteriales bacterium]
MDESGQRVRTPDGRTLRIELWGAPGAAPVLYLHGTPGCRLPFPTDVLDAVGARVRLVSFDRAGYGGSDRLPGRSVSDVAADVATVAAALRIDRLPVIGYSGGGPHALACAALLPELVPAAASVAGVAPFGAAGLDWLAGMAAMNVAEFGAAVQSDQELAAMIGPAARQIVDEPGSFIDDLVAELPAPDVAVLARAAVRTWLVDSTVVALRPGGAGWVDDDLAFVRPWGFDVGTIGVPTALWHGAEDNLVPPSHAAWLAGAIPGAAHRQVPDTGHLGMLDHHADAIAWLLSRSPR